MPQHRSLLLGCGPRARFHIEVYPELRDMEMAAVCDLQEDRAREMAAAHGDPDVFADYETALREIRPDIVHIVTQPGRRDWEVGLAAQHGAKAAVVEKPMALKPSDIEKLDVLHRETGIKIIVNCQRRYFPQFRDGTIRDIITNRIGRLYFIRASTKGNSMAMGPHLMDLLMLFLDEAKPTSVWAMADGLLETGYHVSHQSPERLMAEYWFPDDVRVLFDCDPDALGTPGEEKFWMHLHFDFLGTEGWLHLTQNAGYRYQAHGMAAPERGESSWDHQQRDGQRDFTQAVGDWLNGGPPHLNRFEVGRAVFDALMAAQQSAFLGRRLDLPADAPFTDEQWNALRDRLREGGASV